MFAIVTPSHSRWWGYHDRPLALYWLWMVYLCFLWRSGLSLGSLSPWILSFFLTYIRRENDNNPLSSSPCPLSSVRVVPHSLWAVLTPSVHSLLSGHGRKGLRGRTERRADLHRIEDGITCNESAMTVSSVWSFQCLGKSMDNLSFFSNKMLILGDS